MIDDETRVEAFLAARFGDEIGDVSHLGAGVWSKAFAFQRVGRDYVIRFGAHREDFAKDRIAARYSCPAWSKPTASPACWTGPAGWSATSSTISPGSASGSPGTRPDSASTFEMKPGVTTPRSASTCPILTNVFAAARSTSAWPAKRTRRTAAPGTTASATV